MNTFAAACLTFTLITTPPPEFDPYFVGFPKVLMQIIPADEQQLNDWCGPSVAGFDPQTQMIYGCTDIITKQIYVLEDLCGEAYQMILRHEFAHLNGWPGDHPQ